MENGKSHSQDKCTKQMVLHSHAFTLLATKEFGIWGFLGFFMFVWVAVFFWLVGCFLCCCCFSVIDCGLPSPREKKLKLNRNPVYPELDSVNNFLSKKNPKTLEEIKCLLQVLLKLSILLKN